MSEEVDYRELCLQLLASLTLADNLGDVSEDCDYVREKLGLKNQFLNSFEAEHEDDALKRELHSLGVTTLYGTSIGQDEED